jgi:hypothetical protein
MRQTACAALRPLVMVPLGSSKMKDKPELDDVLAGWALPAKEHG